MDAEQDALVRTFVALEITEEVRGRLAVVQEALKRPRAHVGWVPIGNVHLSLAFLGNMPSHEVDVIGVALDEAAAASVPFVYEVSGVGFFGGAGSPRVVWAGVLPNAALHSLQERVADGLRALEIALPEKDFVPHLTLGRVRSSRGRTELVRAIETQKEKQFGPVPVHRVLLMRSVLDPGGAQYSVLHEARLRVSP